MIDKLNKLQSEIDNSGLNLTKLIALKYHLEDAIKFEREQSILFEAEGRDADVARSQFREIKLTIEANGMGIVPRPVKDADGKICWRVTVRSWCKYYPPSRLYLRADGCWGLEFISKSELCPDESFDLAWALRESGVTLDEWDIR